MSDGYLNQALHEGVGIYSIIHAADAFAEENPAFPIGPGLELVAKQLIEKKHAGAKYLDWTFEKMCQMVLGKPAIMAHLPDKKIHAIKELRIVTGLPLKESKEVIEYVTWTQGLTAVPEWFDADVWCDLPLNHKL